MDLENAALPIPTARHPTFLVLHFSVSQSSNVLVAIFPSTSRHQTHISSLIATSISPLSLSIAQSAPISFFTMAEAAEHTPPVAVEEPPKVVVDLKESESKPETEVGTPATEPDVDPKSRKVTLADLCAKGTALYAQRHYEAATEIFSKASILQAELNGETAPENAEILFHYGRSLFKVGQSKSDVLGGPAAADKGKKANGEAKPKKRAAQTEADKVTQEGVGIVAEQKDAEMKEEGGKPEVDAKKPLFQFTGDENFDDSEGEEGAEGEEDEEEDDDLATAFEILDLARVCYQKRLEQLDKEEQEEGGKGKEVSEGDSPTVKHVKERLADTHDCLAEISLENERYPNAIEDGRISLNYKLELYPEESEIIAEAHYKLSLALEFASVTTAGDDGNAKREDMDQSLRDEAVKEMELAIKSSKLKLRAKEVELATMASPEDNEMARSSIQDMNEVIGDMEQRLVDLRNDPIDAKELLGGDSNPLGGILGATLGESPAETKARVEEAKKTANDLTGLVRKKNKDEPAPAAAPAPEAEAETNGNGKRKAEEPAPAEEEAAAKKAKVEDAQVEA
ncbi:Fc.00g101820.m01.CDS01 [Cosmosporella sp. VM-42]